jgi:hypothetical protein
MMSKRAPLSVLQAQMNAAPAPEREHVNDAPKENRRKAENTHSSIVSDKPSLSLAPKEPATMLPGKQKTPAETQRLKRASYYLPPEVCSMLRKESDRRKDDDREDWPQQAILAEAVIAYLGGK